MHTPRNAGDFSRVLLRGTLARSNRSNLLEKEAACMVEAL
jgi:hypothetical protein